METIAAVNTTATSIYSLGEDFADTGFCDLWTYYPTGETFAVVLPYNSICPSVSTNAGTEAAFFLEGTMYFGLIFLLVVMVQSMEKSRVDWYRLIAFYLIGTLGVPLSNEFGADAAGFNRFIGFGVLVHNMAEAAILSVIWRGTSRQSSWGVRLMIVYFWIMLLLITFLDLHVLLWASSFQGACLDFFLVTSFCTVAVAFGKKGKYFWISFSAALLHILTIQPLFMGMILGWTALSVPTVIFLVPTFMLYIWFASSDPNASLSLAQTKSLVQEQTVINRMQSESVAKATAMVLETIQRGNSGLSLPLTGPQQQGQHMELANYVGKDNTNEEDSSNNNNDTNKVAEVAASVSPMTDTDKPEFYGNAGSSPDNNNRDSSKNSSSGNGNDAIVVDMDGEDNVNPFDDEAYKGHTGQTIRDTTETVEHIIKTGVLYSKHVTNARKLFKRAFVVAIVGALLDEALLISAPCWLDTSFLCD